jgi:hypothetical protein
VVRPQKWLVFIPGGMSTDTAAEGTNNGSEHLNITVQFVVLKNSSNDLLAESTASRPSPTIKIIVKISSHVLDGLSEQ